jgi:hypothetical protein
MASGRIAVRDGSMHASTKSDSQPTRRRPRRLTVFAAAFVAGAAAAIGVNQVLDVHLAQKRPQVESEPIFVALRSLAQGSPVTVWDVALRDWPKAMLPTTAMRAEDSFEGCLLRHPLREGQPLLKVQLVLDDRQARDEMPDVPAFATPAPAAAPARVAELDLWTPAPAGPSVSTTTTVEPPPAVPVAVVAPQPTTSTDVPPPATDTAAVASTPAATSDAEPAPTTAVEPVPVAVVGEPTLAEPQPGEPTLADTPPPSDVAVESVIAARSVTTPAEPEITPAEPIAPPAVAAVEPAPEPEAAAPRKPRDGVVRYLVVPERVALQADAGFAAPAPTPAVAQPPAPLAQTDVRSLPPVRQAAPTTRNRSAQSGQQRPTQQALQPQSRTQPRPQSTQPSRQPPRRQAAPPTTRPPTAATPRGLGSVFPNIAAGIDAMTGKKPRQDDGRFDEAVATDDPPAQTR